MNGEMPLEYGSTRWERKSSDGAISGPFALDELVFLARRGKFQAHDLVREGPAGDWMPARDVAALAVLFDAPQQMSRLTPDASLPPATEEATAAAAAQRPPVPAAPQIVPISSDDKHDESFVLGGIVAAGILFAGLLLSLFFWFWSDANEPGSGPTIAVGPPAEGSLPGTGEARRDVPAEPAAPALAEQSPAGSGSSQAPTAAAAPPPVASPAVPAAAPKPAISSPRKGATKPPETERYEFISSGALVGAVEHALSGKGTDEPRAEYAGRSGGRSEGFLRQRGGDLETERAVYRGLEWLAKHQAADGSWSIESFASAASCNCTAAGHAASDTAATALGLLPFLGAGEIYEGSKYHSLVAKGLSWLLEDQKDNGSFRHEASGNFYAHALATLALSETSGMTDEPAIRSAAQLALDYIVAAQHERGGWRYDPQMPGDLSVTGWQIMALRSGQIARLSIPSATFTRASNFLNQVQCDRAGSTYGYLGSYAPTPCRTAIGLLSREYLGWKKDAPGLRLGSNVLLAALPSPKNIDTYYWYYGTLVMHHLGGVGWHRWNNAMKAGLVGLQIKAGHESGSWTPSSEYDRVGGRLYMTSLAICTLEVYYRYLPLYQSSAQLGADGKKP